MSDNADSPTEPQKEESSTQNQQNVPGDSGDPAKTDEKKKIDVLLKAVGDTPIMKTKKWAVERERTVQALSQFISRFLKFEANEQLFIYVNQSFAPSPDQEVGVLFDACFGLLFSSAFMLEHVPLRLRSLICLSLTSLALAFSVLAFCTSYWCEGTQKVVKPLCLSAVKMEKCGQDNSQDFAVGTVQPEWPSNGTLSPNQTEAFLKPQETQLANAVQYIWETGEDKYILRYFHAGFWESCEKHTDGERCRRFLDLTPDDTHGVLWLSTISEFMHIGLLGMGFLLMWLEVLYSHKKMRALKINAFAALCTVLSGLIGMEAHMMYTTVFQLTVIVGPKDWRPQNWDYGWSFAMAWVSFSFCMGAAVLTLNSYTKTIIEIRHRQRLRQEKAHAAPSYEEVVAGGGIYTISGLQEHPDGMMDSMWLEHETIAEKAEVDIPTLLLIRGCEPEECEDCEREMDEV